jgi:hypothetical protein
MDFDPNEIKRKFDRLHDALEDPHSAYKGGDSLKEVIDYVTRVHEKLYGAVFDGYEGVNFGAELLRDRQAQAQLSLRRDHNRFMERLKTGEFYDQYAEMLLRTRLFEEVGPHYRNKALGIDVGIRLNMHSRAQVGYADEFGDPHMFFNPDGIVLMGEKIKKAGLSHEAAHIALGHTAAGFNPSDDRRKIEQDATYVGALIHGDPKAYNELNYFSQACVKAGVSHGETEEYLSRRRDKFYRRAEQQPGQDAKLDKKIESTLQEKRQHLEYPRNIIYPTIEEKIALVDSIEIPKKSILGKWTRRNVLAEAIRERHVGAGRGQG